MQDKDKTPKEETLEETNMEDSGASDEPKGKVIDPGSPGGDAKDKKPRGHHVKRLTNTANIYLIVFFLVLLVTAGIIVAVVKAGDKNKDKTGTSKAQSLTDKQLAALKGSTTIVGDAQQVLDIQGSSVFEGQVLLRNNLDVAVP
jgi:hypothetical protein